MEDKQAEQGVTPVWKEGGKEGEEIMVGGGGGGGEDGSLEKHQLTPPH